MPKKQSAQRKNLFSLKLYLMTKARRKAEKLQWRQEKRAMKADPNKKHEHDHDHDHEHSEIE